MPTNEGCCTCPIRRCRQRPAWCDRPRCGTRRPIASWSRTRGSKHAWPAGVMHSSGVAACCRLDFHLALPQDCLPGGGAVMLPRALGQHLVCSVRPCWCRGSSGRFGSARTGGVKRVGGRTFDARATDMQLRCRRNHFCFTRRVRRMQQRSSSNGRGLEARVCEACATRSTTGPHDLSW
jgi:hypothetical protein